VKDVFVLKLNPNASSGRSGYRLRNLFRRYRDDTLRGLAVDDQGLIYITGSTTSSATFPVTASALQSSATTNVHVFVSVIDPSKDPTTALVYSTYLGGTNFEEPFGIAISKGKVFVAGYTASDDFPIGGASQLTRAGSYERVHHANWIPRRAVTLR